jgi:acetylornithine/succinyldiaminopimelate/putrescine aminotransferase
VIPDDFRRVRAACTRPGTLFIADEVACGFGRTGRLFASEHFGLKPDMLCLAKAISGGANGMGAMIATAPVAKSLEEDGNAYSTYGWHPLSTEASLASLRYMIRHRTRLLDHVARISDYFRQRLVRMDFRQVPAIRGLAIALEFADEDYVSQLHTRSRERGLLCSSDGSILLLLPALNIPGETARKGLDILQRCA